MNKNVDLWTLSACQLTRARYRGVAGATGRSRQPLHDEIAATAMAPKKHGTTRRWGWTILVGSCCGVPRRDPSITPLRPKLGGGITLGLRMSQRASAKSKGPRSDY